MLLVTCDTLGEALEELMEYTPVISDGGEFGLRRQTDLVFVEYRPRFQVRQAERAEAAMACQLPGSDLRLSQIPEQLGFFDENAFTRAFRRWQGVTPARYRETRR